MKKQILTLAIAGLIIATFSSCKDEPTLNNDASVIRATNIVEIVGGSLKNVAIVKAEHFAFTGKRWTTLAETPFKNNGFVLNLPEILPEEFLTPNYFGDFRSFETTAFNAYDRNGRRIGWFFYEAQAQSGNLYLKTWIYSDTDVAKTEWRPAYNKGWNTVYFAVQQGWQNGGEWPSPRRLLDKSQLPRNLTFNWYFWSFD